MRIKEEVLVWLQVNDLRFRVEVKVIFERCNNIISGAPRFVNQPATKEYRVSRLIGTDVDFCTLNKATTFFSFI